MPLQRPAAAAGRGPYRIARDECLPPEQILMELVHRVGQCHRQLRQLLNDNIDEANVNDTAFLVMWLCAEAESPGVPQGDLTSAAGVSAAQMSSLLERLRRQGWLTSVRLEGDRRRQWWRLTDAGRHIQQRIRNAVAPAADRLAGKLSSGERIQLRMLLDRLAAGDEAPPGLKTFEPQGRDDQDVGISQGGGE